MFLDRHFAEKSPRRFKEADLLRGSFDRALGPSRKKAAGFALRPKSLGGDAPRETRSTATQRLKGLQTKANPCEVEGDEVAILRNGSASARRRKKDA